MQANDKKASDDKGKEKKARGTKGKDKTKRAPVSKSKKTEKKKRERLSRKEEKLMLEARRSLIASLRIKGQSEDKIMEELKANGYDITSRTYYRDLKEIDKGFTAAQKKVIKDFNPLSYWAQELDLIRQQIEECVVAINAESDGSKKASLMKVLNVWLERRADIHRKLGIKLTEANEEDLSDNTLTIVRPSAGDKVRFKDGELTIEKG